MKVSRIHQSWFAGLEKRLLISMAEKLPSAIKPDHLTFIGFIGSLVAGLAYCASNVSVQYLWLASFGLLMNWFGDSLDGTLSRYRKIERPRYGFFIDHSTDVYSQLFLFLGLGCSPYMHFSMACMALLSYWIASLYTFIRAIATEQFQISYGGLGPTEIRLALILNNCFWLVCDPISFAIPYFGRITLLDLIVGVIFTVVSILFLTMIWVEGRRLARLEQSS